MSEDEINDYFNFVNTEIDKTKVFFDDFCVRLETTQDKAISTYLAEMRRRKQIPLTENGKEELFSSHGFRLGKNDIFHFGASLVTYSNLKKLVKERNLKETFLSYGFLISSLMAISNNRLTSDIRKSGGDTRAKNDERTKALKTIKDVDYPLNKHLFHLRGRRTKFINDMFKKYPVFLSSGSIESLVDKLNKDNGISQKKK